MNKTTLDLFVMTTALFAGLALSISDNPLTGCFVLLGTLISWEILTHVPAVKKVIKAPIN